MTLPEPLAAESAECPQCGQPAEPEQEDTLLYFSCSGPRGCGAEFGYRRVLQGPACAAGVFEAPQPGSVFLGTTIGRRPE